jgi:hypothetical protein
MAEIETITILKVGTEEAVQSIGDLKNNIKLLKKDLDDLEIGTQEYQDTLDELKVNQNALKDAMYATSSSMEDLAEAATGTSESYNSLVHRMAAYKEELRTVDTSTEAGMQRFKELAAQVKGVNDRLKELDAMQGNYQRNVGSYEVALKNFHNVVKDLPPSMNAVKKAGDQLDKSFAIMSVNPIIGVITLVAPLINKIADGLKDNEKATAALQKALKALEPVGKFFEGLLDKIADALSWVVDKAVELAGRSDGVAKKVIAGVTGVGNAIFQFLIAPLKTFIEVVKGAGTLLKDIFTGQWKNIKEDAQAAGQAIGAAIDKGWNFKQNFQSGQDAATAFVEGLTSSQSRKKVKDGAAAIAKDAKDEFDDIIRQIEADMEKASADLDKSEAALLKTALRREKERLEAIDAAAKYRQEVNAATVDDERKRQDESYRIQQEGNERKLAALKEFQQAAIERGDLDAYLDYEKQVADMEVQIEVDALEERARIRRQDVEDAERAAAAKAALMQEYAAGVADVLGSIASLYDVNADKDKRSFENSKRFQIAETWVNTLAGMASAVWATWNDKTIPSAIAKAALAATNAAGILASGIATTAKIRATQFGGGGAGAAVVSAAAPSVPAALPQVLQAQTASDEERLNRAAEPSRVYILQSDIEAAGRAQRVRVAESTF